MNRTIFTPKSPGRLVNTVQGPPAFVPNPLPPAIDVTWQLSRQLSEADRTLGTLVGLARLLPNPHLVTRPFMRREAVLSSRIEGTQASLSDLMFYEAIGEPMSERSDVREVANYVSALEYGLERLHALPLSLRFIRELHHELMTGVRGGTRQPGEFRRVQNWIGPEGSTLAEATYVPPPVDEMLGALAALECYFHEESELPPLVRTALIHYQFEAIHPFLDGNGRIGRLLVFFVLQLARVMDEPLLYLSGFFERHRDEYYRRLLAVSTDGAWHEWVDFFLRGVAEQASDAIIRTRALLRIIEIYRQMVRKARNSGTLMRIIDMLLQVPVVNVAAVAQGAKISHPAAKKNVARLVERGIIAPRVVGRRTYFVAEEIIETIAA
jgi:Fic family protein